MKYSVKPEFAGRSTRCATCKQPLVVPQPAPPPDQTIAQVSGSPIQGAASSLAKAGVEGGVTLDSVDDAPSDRKSIGAVLASRTGDTGRYLVEGEIARGGMGAVLRAVDCDIRREVAVKYLLDQSNKQKKLRFVEEAQITGQLEHPNIVPIHELGVDAQERVFFAMKMVKGRSLAQVLDALRTQPKSAEKEYTLGRLLNIFINVCNALAYAHARGVIHRDLKPANIMIGDFGEVYVMDWGLAKVLKGNSPLANSSSVLQAMPASLPPIIAPRGKGPPPATLANGTVHNAPVAVPVTSGISTGTSKVVTSRELDEDLTQEGAVMGTPMYMPPEQASGHIHAIDQRSDVYSLGAILYELIALRPPISKEGGYLAILMRVTQGEILPPEQNNQARVRAGKISPELAAVAVKALAKNPDDRYQTVEALRKDVELFLEGRSVSAKEDTRREQFIKFVKRNKGFSTAAAAALVLLAIVVGWSSWINFQARRVAEKAQADYQAEQAEKEARTRQAVPALVELARQDIKQRKFDKAYNQVKLALEYDEDNLNARLLLGQLLVQQEKFKDASAELARYLAKKPKDADTRTLKKLCDAQKPEDLGILLQITQILTTQELPDLAEGLLRKHGTSGPAVRSELLVLYKKRINDAWPDRGNGLRLDKEGQFHFDLTGPDIKNLEPLKDIPLSGLNLGNVTELKDWSALQGMSLTALNIHQCLTLVDLNFLKGLPLKTLSVQHCGNLIDCSGLQGLPLTRVDFQHCHGIRETAGLQGLPLEMVLFINCNGITDLSGLTGLKLKSLSIIGSHNVRDLTPLRGMPLADLNITGCGNLRDLSPLKNLPFTSLNLSGCGIIADLSPLNGSRLKILDLTNCAEISDLSSLSGMPLDTLHLKGCFRIQDLSPLKGMPLTYLNLSGCAQVKNLTPLEGMKLTTLELAGCASLSDLSPLKGMSFTSLDLQNCQALTDLSSLKGMPLQTLLLNNCGEVKDLSPLRGMRLRRLELANCAKITDLSPIKNFPLESLDLSGCAGIKELIPLKGLGFHHFKLHGCTSLVDISGLQGASFTFFHLSGCPKLVDLSGLNGIRTTNLTIDDCDGVTDLSPLQGLMLTNLSIVNCKNLADLSGLQGVTATMMNLTGCIQITDLTPLKNSSITALHLVGCPKLVDLSPIQGLKLTHFDASGTSVKDITPLKSMPLVWLNLGYCGDLHDLRPLAGMKIESMRLPPKIDKGMDTIRAMKTLTEINGQSSERFWSQWDATRPKNK